MCDFRDAVMLRSHTLLFNRTLTHTKRILAAKCTTAEQKYRWNISVSITVSTDCFLEPMTPIEMHHAPLSPGGSAPTRSSSCVGKAPSPAAGGSGPRPSEAAWTGTLPADSGHTSGSSVGSTCENALQNPAGLGTRAPGPLWLLPSSLEK